MVDVSGKKPTMRTAIAGALVKMGAETIEALKAQKIPKGDVFSVARIAGIMAAKQTAQLIPLCHPLGLDYCDVQFSFVHGGIRIRAEARAHGATGVEMEALTAASVAALTMYDMCISLDKAIVVTDIMLLEKHGGKSGSFAR